MNIFGIIRNSFWLAKLRRNNKKNSEFQLEATDKKRLLEISQQSTYLARQILFKRKNEFLVKSIKDKLPDNIIPKHIHNSRFRKDLAKRIDFNKESWTDEEKHLISNSEVASAIYPIDASENPGLKSKLESRFHQGDLSYAYNWEKTFKFIARKNKEKKEDRRSSLIISSPYLQSQTLNTP